MFKRPSIQPQDPQFVRDLKNCIIDMDDRLRRQRVLTDGLTTRKDETSGGVMIHAKAPRLAPVSLISRTNSTTYVGNVYENGTDKDATETAATIRILGSDNDYDLTESIKSKWMALRVQWQSGTDYPYFWSIVPDVPQPELIREIIRDSDPGDLDLDWYDLIKAPVKILGKDEDGVIGWVGVCQPD